MFFVCFNSLVLGTAGVKFCRHVQFVNVIVVKSQKIQKKGCKMLPDLVKFTTFVLGLTALFFGQVIKKNYIYIYIHFGPFIIMESQKNSLFGFFPY